MEVRKARKGEKCNLIRWSRKTKRVLTCSRPAIAWCETPGGICTHHARVWPRWLRKWAKEAIADARRMRRESRAIEKILGSKKKEK